jgi:predicted small secreted protein
MRMRRTFCVTLLFSLATLAIVACSKTNGFGSDFEGAVTMHTTTPGSAGQDMIVKAKGDKLRFDLKSPQGDPMHGVFDPKANKVVVFFDSTRTYMDMDFAKPSASPNTDPGTSAVTKSGNHETIAGFDCEDWTVKDPTGKRSELCIAQGIAYFDVASLRPGSSGATSPLAKEFRDKKSFPLRAVEYDAAGKELSRMEVTKIEKVRVDDAAFATPSDFTKVTLPK